MKALIFLVLFAGTAQAQALPQGKAVKGIEVDSKALIDALHPHVHTLMHGSCKGQPDHVYGESKGVYFACISGQEICTEAKAHNGAGVPRALITQYQQVKAIQEAERAEYERKQQERQEQLVREGRSTGDPAADAALARRRAEAIANEVKTARAQGRQPNLAQFAKSGAAPAASPRASTPARAVAKRDVPPPLADEQLNGIAVGAALSDVLKKLGDPQLRIMGGSESLTYQLQSGGSVQLIFARGVLTRIERAEP